MRKYLCEYLIVKLDWKEQRDKNRLDVVAGEVEIQ